MKKVLVTLSAFAIALSLSFASFADTLLLPARNCCGCAAPSFSYYQTIAPRCPQRIFGYYMPVNGCCGCAAPVCNTCGCGCNKPACGCGCAATPAPCCENPKPACGCGCGCEGGKCKIKKHKMHRKFKCNCK